MIPELWFFEKTEGYPDYDSILKITGLGRSLFFIIEKERK
jgi:hypothetical protein